MEKEIKVSISIKTKDLFRFLLYHTYTGISGIIGVLISLGAVYMLIVNYTSIEMTGIIILVIASLLFTVIQPIQLYAKAKQQILLNPTYKEPFNYIFNENGIKVSQKESEAEVKWEDLAKVIATKSNILIYTSKVTAFIIPKKNIADNYEDLVNIMNSKLEKNIMKIKVSK